MNTLWNALGGMTPSWMLLSLLISGLVLVAAEAAHDAQRAANRSVRWVWLGAMALILALSVAAPWRRPAASLRRALPSATVSNLAPTASAASPSDWSHPIREIAHIVMTVLDRVQIAVGAALQSVDSALSQMPSGVGIAIATAWLVASLATLGMLLYSYARMRRLMRQWPVRRVANADARIAPAIGPAVMGLAPAEIVLPSWLLDRTAHEQELVVAHEREHVRARDPLMLVVACAAVAIMPWNPALWYALNRLRLAIELDCDRRVLQRGIATEAYGSLLIDLSALRTSVPAFSMPAFACNTSFLERRLLAMTARRLKFSTSRRLVGGLIALAAVVTACESKLPTSAEVEKMDVASAEAQAKKVALVADGKTTYIVDGKTVSEEAAKKIEAEKIATVSVRKAATGSAFNEIEITTSELARRRAIEANGQPMKMVPDSGATGIMLRRTAGPDSLREERVNSQAQSSTYKRKFDGLLVVNDKVVDPSELDRISPDQIVTINVLKGEAARREFNDPRAANGVIKVVTKK